MTFASSGSSSGLILVIGSSGTTGSRLVQRLTDRGADVRGTRRKMAPPDECGSVRFDWWDATTHAAALAGVSKMYLIPPTGTPDPAPAMLPFLDMAYAAGVKRVVLHSNSVSKAGDAGIGMVHQHIEATFPEWAVLRPSWFMQNVIGAHPIARMIQKTGHIVTATGSARVGFVDVGDIAEAGAVCLSSDVAPNTDFTLTGPQALSYGDLAATLSVVTKRSIAFESVSLLELPDRYRQIGVPGGQARFLATMDAVIASGHEDRVTDAVTSLTGNEPRSFETFAKTEFLSAANSETLTTHER